MAEGLPPQIYPLTAAALTIAGHQKLGQPESRGVGGQEFLSKGPNNGYIRDLRQEYTERVFYSKDRVDR